jgi:tetratricopeptide (TPR) repeat protein
MAMLTGDVESHWAVGSITGDHARRLWETLPLVVEMLLERGPSLIGTILSGEALFSRVAAAFPDRFDLLNRLQAITEQSLASPLYPKQGHLFEQYTNVMRSLSDQYPLVLLLDDMHWADSGSSGLLFHLGRRLANEGSRVLVACAYRPEEVGWGHAGQRHPLVKALSEFKLTYGDVWVDLATADQSAGRRFVDAYLDTQPNRLTEDFRAALFQHTEGHPLFTIELLRAMQERGDLIKDDDADSAWIEGPALDWDRLPARIEAVIEQRVGRLDPELQQIIAIASVEGDTFIAQVVADVQNMEERTLLYRLSSELERRHRLVREQGELQVGESRLTRYKFGHVLIQNYLYQSLSQGERRLLHRQIANSLETFYIGQLDTIAVQLAHHFHKAGDYNQALRYFTMAGEHASRVYANDEAIAHYTRAIKLAERVSLDAIIVAKLRCDRGLAYETLGEFEQAYVDHEEALQIARVVDDHQMEWLALLNIGKLWSSRDYDLTREYYEQALEIARHMDAPLALANSLNQIGNWYLNAEKPQRAKEYHLQALEICRETEDRRCLASTLDLLGIANLLGNDFAESFSYYDQAITLFRELDDRPRLVSSLTGRGYIGGAAYSYLTAVPATIPGDARRDIEEALKIAREIDSPPGEAWALWALSLLNSVRGQFGQALEVARSGLCIASSIEHREWVTGNRYALGNVYRQLFALEEARRQLNQALALAKELQSQHWIYVTTGSLAAVCFLSNNLAQAQAYLDTVLTPQTPMDTMAKRYCWARRAELALLQDDPALTLEIADRLIASSAGMLPGCVITFLWLLKGKALATKGQPDEASILLLAAIENAQVTQENFLLWRLYASLGGLYRAAEREVEAEKALSAARVLIEEMADTIPDDALKENFRQQATKALDSPD